MAALPRTQEEWRKAIGEVKRKYFGKRYRACSARCIEILDGIKDASQVEPAYLIYLHFYAATSMEICARPLPSTSALRATLLQQARTHFDQASALINAAEESVLRKFRPGSVSSSCASSCHSPSGSVSSRTCWTPDTRVSSPTDSICSFDDDLASPKSPSSLKTPGSPQQKRVKKVSFSLPKDDDPAVFRFPTEPFIRPDSPTLGFGSFGCLDDFQEIEMPLHTIHESDEEEDDDHHSQTSHHTNQPPFEEEEEQDAPHHLAHSITRACEHLSSLRSQLARHSTSLEEMLANAARTTTNSHSRTHSRSMSTSSTSSFGGEDARAADRKERIERLRNCGWQRKRFNARRYEELCESVMAEMS
ncbi:hypothetical protein N0V88_004011 [Collariella sp. IMI 366227]|nr:hypothetical protein N0V88_004011 [Collariella sp. IMI 366227]